MPSSKPHRFSLTKLGDSFNASASGQCPICGFTSAECYTHKVGWQTQFAGWCPACTNFFITSDAIEEAKRRNLLHLISAYLRRLAAEDFHIIAIDELDSCVSKIPRLSILEQFDAALKAIYDECPVIGGDSQFDAETDWPLISANSTQTMHFILAELWHRGYLQASPFGETDYKRPLCLTWKGYERLQEIQASGKSSQNVFVAMAFKNEVPGLWEDAVRPAIEDAGYKAIRVDKVEHNRSISDEIIALIRSSRFVVADFTQQNQGVYFEAGFALGLGRNVIWMCSESDKNALHFDTRQYAHIMYQDLNEARLRLKNRIEALEGHGSYIRQS